MSNRPFQRADQVGAWFVGPPTLRHDVPQLNALLDDFLDVLRTLHRDMPTVVRTSEPRSYGLTPKGRAALDEAFSSGDLDYYSVGSGDQFSGTNASMSVWISEGSTEPSPDPTVSVHLHIQRTLPENEDVVFALVAFLQRWFIRLGCASGLVGNDSGYYTKWESATNKASLPARWSLVTKHGRGAFWGTALGADLCHRLGGRERVLQEAPAIRAEPLGDGAWLQVSDTFPPKSNEIERLSSYLAPILDWTRDDWQQWIKGHGGSTASQLLADAGVIRAASVNPNDTFPIRLLDDMEVNGDVAVPKDGVDDVAYNLYLERLPSETERDVIQAIIAEWSRGEQQRIRAETPQNSYGWFHHVTVPAFNGAVARWRIDTSCRGVQWRSIEALRQWFAGVPNLQIHELVLGFEHVG